mmetsp:Transcript_599/g.1461  ORF Transcript_599/g.1461 Transcript_599/m.1461 type:complete len:300 (-) Transcript_599:1114-2013(-)
MGLGGLHVHLVAGQVRLIPVKHLLELGLLLPGAARLVFRGTVYVLHKDLSVKVPVAFSNPPSDIVMDCPPLIRAVHGFPLLEGLAPSVIVQQLLHVLLKLQLAVVGQDLAFEEDCSPHAAEELPLLLVELLKDRQRADLRIRHPPPLPVAGDENVLLVLELIVGPRLLVEDVGAIVKVQRGPAAGLAVAFPARPLVRVEAQEHRVARLLRPEELHLHGGHVGERHAIHGAARVALRLDRVHYDLDLDISRPARDLHVAVLGEGALPGCLLASRGAASVGLGPLPLAPDALLSVRGRVRV